MKARNTNRLVLMVVLTAVAGFVALAVWGVPPAGESLKTKVTTSMFHVTGMTCGGCEVGVRRIQSLGYSAELQEEEGAAA